MVESRNDRAENAWGLGCCKGSSSLQVNDLSRFFFPFFFEKSLIKSLLFFSFARWTVSKEKIDYEALFELVVCCDRLRGFWRSE